jgi:hypothetical protein
MAVFHWLQETPLAITVRDSAFLLGFLSGLHLVGFTLLSGGVLVSTLRLGGVFLAEHDAPTITRPAARAVVIGLAVSVVTGFLLFAPRAADASLNRTFQWKMLLLGTAAAFQFTIHRYVRRRPDVSRGRQQLTGLTAFLLWMAVGVAGSAFILLE